MKKRILIYILIITMMMFVLTACGSETTNTTSSKTNTSTKSSNKVSNSTKKEEVKMDYESSAVKQMAMPNSGDTVAIIHVRNYGDIKVKFFSDVAPKAVENFTTHAKEGYYNGIIFHRVINEFMIQGGDPLGTGTGGESIWGKDFEEELSQEIVPYRGTLCMASRGLQNSPSLGSQFFITQAHYTDEMGNYYKKSGANSGLLNMYKKYGGYLSLYMQYTIFGQVYEGMEVVDKIAAVQTNSNDKPLEDVVIETIDVTTYQGE